MVQGYPNDNSCSGFWGPQQKQKWRKSLQPIPERNPEVDTRLPSSTELRILVDIRMSNGVYLSQKNLSYEGLKSLVEKLEGLCWILQA